MSDRTIDRIEFSGGVLQVRHYEDGEIGLLGDGDLVCDIVGTPEEWQLVIKRLRLPAHDGAEGTEADDG